MLKYCRLSGFSDMGLLRLAHPFSQQAVKASSHTDSSRIYLVASSADTRLSGPSAGQASNRTCSQSSMLFSFLNNNTSNCLSYTLKQLETVWQWERWESMSYRKGSERGKAFARQYLKAASLAWMPKCLVTSLLVQHVDCIKVQHRWSILKQWYLAVVRFISAQHIDIYRIYAKKTS